MLMRSSPHYAEALALWVLAGSWCCDQEAEQHTGEFPRDVLGGFGITDWREACDLLVRVRLWDARGEDTVRFHDWPHWNGTDAKFNRSREQTRQRKERQRKRDCEQGKHSKDCPPDTCPRKYAKQAASRSASRRVT